MQERPTFVAQLHTRLTRSSRNGRTAHRCGWQSGRVHRRRSGCVRCCRSLAAPLPHFRLLNSSFVNALCPATAILKEVPNRSICGTSQLSIQHRPDLAIHTIQETRPFGTYRDRQLAHQPREATGGRRDNPGSADHRILVRRPRTVCTRQRHNGFRKVGHSMSEIRSEQLIRPNDRATRYHAFELMRLRLATSSSFRAGSGFLRNAAE